MQRLDTPTGREGERALVTLLAPTLQAFFTERMASQVGASPHTVTAYCDTWRLLLTYLADAAGTPPQNLDLPS